MIASVAVLGLANLIPQAEFSGETSPGAVALRLVFHVAGLRFFFAATAVDFFVDGLLFRVLLRKTRAIPSRKPIRHRLSENPFPSTPIHFPALVRTNRETQFPCCTCKSRNPLK